MTVGILVEKPSAGRHFAAALGGMSGRFDGEEFVIAVARGHLYEFVPPHRMVTDPGRTERYRSWAVGNLPWDPAEFSWELEVIDDALDTVNGVKRALTGCEEIVIATDVDPSGEGGMIAVNAFLQLGLRPRVWSRMYFTDEAPASLRKAFADRVRIPELTGLDEYRKAVYRAKFDFLSMQWTRCATAIARASGQNVVLRQGRLKSAMVQLVGDQLQAHTHYVKKPFFQNRFRDENGVTYTDPDEPRFDQAVAVPASFGASAVVQDSTTAKRTVPPKLLDLAALSAILVGKGVRAAAVLATYQRMYEVQVVSYPRTEDKTITPAQFDELTPLVDQIAVVAGVDPALLTHREPRATHVRARGAHGANRPGPQVPASLDVVEARFGIPGRWIYEALARSFLAMLAQDCQYEQHKGYVEDYPTFVGTVNVPVHAGWKAVFDPDAGEDPAEKPGPDDDEPLESSTGLGRTAAPFVHEGAPKRPEHPSMRWLMKQLEKRDVGTGATRTSTYSEVTSTATRYPLLVENGRKLTLAPAGEMSWRLLPGTRIGDLRLTERVYADMRDIAAGTATARERLAVVADWVREDIATMTRNAAAMRTALGLTDEPVTVREKATGTWRGCDITFAREWGGHRFTDNEVQKLLAGETIAFQAKSQKGQTFDVYGALAEQEHEGRRYVGFMKEGFGRRDEHGAALPPRQWCAHVFTADEVQQLIAGEAVTAADFVSKKGKRFRCTLRFAEQKKGQGKKIIPDFG